MIKIIRNILKEKKERERYWSRVNSPLALWEKEPLQTTNRT